MTAEAGPVELEQTMAAPTAASRLQAPGDRRTAVASLFEEHGEAIFGYCVRLVRDRDLAEDLMQQVFLEAYRDFDRFRGMSSRRTWLFGIAGHRCLDALRTRRQRATEPYGDEIADAEVAPDMGPSERLDHARLLVALDECLGSLSPESRAIVLMRFQREFTYQQMAAQLEASPDALQMRISRVMPFLLRCLERKGWGNG